MVYSKPYKIVGRVGRSSLRKVMKIKTAFIIFAILVLSFICLRSGTVTTGRLPVWNLDQPSTPRAKYIGGKEVETISGMNLAQQKEPARAPFFQGEELPTPPQQNAPWPHGADALSNAAATLFEQGLADWDKTAAISTLEKRLNRAWSIGAQPNDILAFNGNPVEHFGTMIAKMTLARARCGDETAYDEYAAWIQRVELKGISFRVEELQKPLIQGAAHPSIEQAIDYLFNDPKSPWSNVLAEGHVFLLLGFWQTPLPNTAGFRKQALRALTDKSLAGDITFHPRKDWNSSAEAQIELKGLSIGFRGSNDDPNMPPPGQKVSFRVCDAYAYFYSQYQNGPKFHLFWPENKRDAGVLACRKWLEAKISAERK